MFGNVGFPEIMLILVIVLLVFGAKRLPEIGASFGKGIREFKRSLNDATEAINSEPDSSSGSRQIDSSRQPSNSGDPKRLSQ